MKQPTEKEKNVSIFISYSRKDKLFVQKLHENLVATGLETWVDWEGIPLTADWWQEIKQGIENTDAFAFVVSPDSLRSKVCADEIQTAVDNNKRLIPILHRDPEKGDPIHPKISAHNWIFMRNEEELQAHMPDMVQVIHTDLDWVKAHTRLLRRAVEWDTNGKNSSFLLHGDNLKRAEQWLTNSSGKEPAPSELQSRYIHESRVNTTRRTRITVVGIVATLIIAFFAILSYVQSVEATRQRGFAENARATAVINEQDALLQREIAIFAQATAEAAAEDAETQRQIAEVQRDNAIIAEEDAETQRQIAEEERDRAVIAEEDAARQRDIANILKEEALALKSTITGELLAQQNKLILSALVALHSYQRYQTVEGEQLIRSLLARLPAAQSKLVHDDWINTVQFSTDNQRLLSSSDDGTARVWDVATGAELLNLPHDGYVFVAAYSPDNTLIATGDAQEFEDGSYAGVVTLWNAETGEPIYQFTQLDWINDLEFSPDGRYLAYGVYDGSIRVINVQTGIPILTANQSAPIWDVTFSPDGGLLVTSDDNGRSWVWDIQEVKVLVTLAHDDSVYGAAFSPNGTRLVTYSADGSARIWNRFNWLRVATVFHENWIVDATFSPDSTTLATASADGIARLWNPENGKEIFDMEHLAFVNDVEFSFDGNWVVTSSDDNTAVLWDTSTGQKINTMIHESPVYVSTFSSNNELLSTGDLSGIINLWSITEDTPEIGRITHPDIVTDLALTTDGRQLITISSDGLRVWSEEDVLANDLRLDDATRFFPSSAAPQILALAPNNQIAAAANQRTGVSLWNFTTGETLPSLADDQNISALAFSPDGTKLVTAGSSPTGNSTTTFNVWNMDTGKAVVSDIPAFSNITDLTFSPDGQYFVAAGSNGRIQFYNTENGTAEQEFLHIDEVKTLAFSPDGRFLASGSSDNTTRVWNVNTGVMEASLFHSSPVISLAFSPDITFLYTGDESGNIRLWEMGTWQELGRIYQGDPVAALVAHPNGRTLITANNILAVLWDIEATNLLRPHELLNATCSRLTRDLTPSEWEQYIAFADEEGTHEYQPVCSNQ